MSQAPQWSLPSIRGGSLSSADFAGKAVLVVNTASLCGYTPQYAEMQKLYQTYKDQGLVVLAVPSNDFEQEKDSNAEVKDFCEGMFGITLPMVEITSVKGPAAHPLYKWLESEADYVPEWNFAKVLLDRQGKVAATFPAAESPLDAGVVVEIERVLAA